MNTRKTLVATIALCAATLLPTACDKADTESRMPEFAGFEYQQPVIAGQPLTITARQSQLGHLLSTTTYKWVAVMDWNHLAKGTSGRDTCYVVEKKLNYSADNADPQIQFVVPDTATILRISFTAEYAYAGQGQQRYDGGTTSQPAGVSGYIRPVTSNALFGKTQGSLTIRVGKIANR